MSLTFTKYEPELKKMNKNKTDYTSTVLILPESVHLFEWK